MGCGSGLAMAGAGENFSEVEGRALPKLHDLLAATKAVGDDDCVRPGGAHGGEQVLVRNCARDFEFFRFKAKRSGHAAAAGLDGLDRGTGLAEESDFICRAAEDRLVVAVTVHQNARAGEPRREEIGVVRGEKVGEEPGLAAEALRERIVGKELEQFIFKNAGAARLEEDERQIGFDLRRHAAKNAGEIRARGIEETEVVERAATADVPMRSFDVEAGASEHGFSSGECLRMVVVVPGVGPQQN